MYGETIKVRFEIFRNLSEFLRAICGHNTERITSRSRVTDVTWFPENWLKSRLQYMSNWLRCAVVYISRYRDEPRKQAIVIVPAALSKWPKPTTVILYFISYDYSSTCNSIKYSSGGWGGTPTNIVHRRCNITTTEISFSIQRSYFRKASFSNLKFSMSRAVR